MISGPTGGATDGLRPLTPPRLYEQITRWIDRNGLGGGDRLPSERELAARLGVSRATVSQALVALEVSDVAILRDPDRDGTE